MEMRGHDNDVEVVVFAPLAAYTAIRELAGIPVCLSSASSSRAQRHLFFQSSAGNRRAGLYAASGARDKTIKIWDTQSGQMLKNLVSLFLFPLLVSDHSAIGWP